MKKINITITAPDVDIIAKIMMKIQKKLNQQEGVTMDVSYEDDSVRKIAENENKRSEDQ